MQPSSCLCLSVCHSRRESAFAFVFAVDAVICTIPQNAGAPPFMSAFPVKELAGNKHPEHADCRQSNLNPSTPLIA